MLHPLRTSLLSRWLVPLVYLVASLLTGMVPLASDLHYEFAALMALAASVVSGVAVVMRSDGPLHKGSGGDDHHREIDQPGSITSILGRQLALGAIPLGVGIVRSFFATQCGLADGIIWYLVLVPTSIVVGTAVGLVAERMFRRRWLRLLLWLGLWSASLVRGAYEALTGPHIFLYAWQIGYYPGASWEAELPVGGTLLVYQLLHLLAAAMLLRLLIELARRSRMPVDRPNRAAESTNGVLAATLLLLAVLVGLQIISRADIGLVRTNQWVREQLGDSLRTPHATLYYNRSGVDSLDLWSACTRTEFYITEHAHRLQIPDSAIPHVEVYLYRSRQEEKEMIGTGNLFFTKPWLGQLHITFGTSPSTLRHEIAHIMLADWGRFLGISPWQGLLEGAAVALEDPKEWRSLEENAVALRAFGRTPSLDRLMSFGGFTSYPSTVGYRYSGAFCDWLIRTRGAAKFLEVYRSADFTGVYGVPIDRLDTLFRRHLDSLPRPDSSRTIVSAYEFGGIPFFQQRCLRRIGALNRRGDDAMAEGRYGRALDFYNGSLEEGINLGARRGLLRSLAGLGEYRRMLDSLDVYDADSVGRALLPFLVERGDAHWGLGNIDSARSIYRRVVQLGIDRWTTIRGAQRLWFVDAEPTLRRIMQLYFTRPLDATQRLVLLDHAIGISNDTTGRRLLGFMRALLTADRMPRTTLEILQPFLPVAGEGRSTDIARAREPQPSDPRGIAAEVVIWESAIDLLEAELHASTITPFPEGWKRLEQMVVDQRSNYHSPLGEEHQSAQIDAYRSLKEFLRVTARPPHQ